MSNVTQAQYGSTNQPPPSHGQTPSGSLPLTGFEMGALLIVAGVLCGAGILLRMLRDAV